ncbi:MAG: hypothetical protein V4541_05065 [Bacteroidota bacterium]
MKYIYTLSLIVISIFKVSAQTQLQLRFINDPKDTINKELKERYALKQQIIKLQTAINTSNKPQFLKLMTSNSKRIDLYDLFYYADSLELNKHSAWKRCMILMGRLYWPDTNKTFKTFNALNIDYFYDRMTRKKPIDFNNDKLFEKISVYNGVGTFNGLRFRKEGNLWNLDYAATLNSNMEETFSSGPFFFGNEGISNHNLYVEINNRKIIDYIEKEEKVKIPSDIWKPLKNRTAAQIKK